MKTKSLLALATLAAAGAASAAVTSANTLCRIEIQSPTKNTIVSVPLKKVAGDGTAIKLTDLVLTDGLTEGDYMLRWNDTGKKWEAWSINASLEWAAMTVTEGSITWDAATVTGDFPCGNAFWLVRNTPTDDGNPKSFYLYGEVVGQSFDMPNITRVPTADTYIMMGNTNLADVAINSLEFNGTPESGDKIMVPATTGLGVTEYTYTNLTQGAESQWCKPTFTHVGNRLSATIGPVTAEDKIPAGQGFWYVAKPSGAAQ